jgi:hypothetical protein
MKLNYLFTAACKSLWYAKNRLKCDRDEVVVLWDCLIDLLQHDKFSASGLDTLRDDCIKLVFDEYEKGSESSKEAAFRFLNGIEASSKLKPFFRHDLSKFVGARVSPSYCATIKATQDARLLGPVLRLLEDAALRAVEKGSNIFTPVFDSYLKDETYGNTNFYYLMQIGVQAYRVVLLAMFPPVTSEITKHAEAKKKSAVKQGMQLLEQGFKLHPELLGPFFPHVIEWIILHYPFQFVVDTLLYFQGLFSLRDTVPAVNHPHMASLVWATRGLTNLEWRREWAWNLVSTSVASLSSSTQLSNVALHSFAVIVKIEPTVAFKMVDMGMFAVAVEAGKGQEELLCELIAAYSSLRALHELLQFLVTGKRAEGKTTIRDAYVNEKVRAVARDSLRKCLPSVATTLALVPGDAVATRIVMDILRWGPVGPQAIASGWNGSVWGTKLHQCAAENKTALMECFFNALHYRWDPLLLEKVMQQREQFGLDQISNPVQRIRFARDFPKYWNRPDNGVEVCKKILGEKQTDEIEWGLLLWAGEDVALKAWLKTAPEGSLYSVDSVMAWGPGTGGEMRTKQTVDAILKLPLERATLIAGAAPLRLFESYYKRTVKAFVRVNQMERLADLLAEYPQYRAEAKKLWLKKKTPLGPRVAVSLDDEEVWKSALASPRPIVWQYLALCKNPALALQRFQEAGEEAYTEPAYWTAWENVLGLVDEQLWVEYGKLLIELFSSMWCFLQWDVLIAYHEALKRLNVAGAQTALKKSLSLVLKLGCSQDAVISSLLSLADYKLSLVSVLEDDPLSCRIVFIFLSLDPVDHNVPLLRPYIPTLMSMIMQCQDPLLAARCSERLLRIAPPFDPDQMAFYLQPCILSGPSVQPAVIKAAMSALHTARRVCPPVWFRGAGIVAAIESRGLELVSHIPESSKRSRSEEEEWVNAARSLGREIGGGGADLKKRKHYLTYALADWLTRGEPRAALAVRKAVWEEGLLSTMEAVLMNETQQAYSFHLIRGAVVNKAAWKRYKKKFMEQDAYRGKI